MWDKRLTQLRDALATIIILPQQAVPFVMDAGISPAHIEFNGPPSTFWFNILNFASNNRQVDDLVKALLKAYPKNPHLLAYKETLIQDYSLGPNIETDVVWDAADDRVLEKITGNTNTLLPIRFLSIGLEKAKSVARVEIKSGNQVELGTGFVVKNNWFVTNNHVIKDAESARIANIQFNYEESTSGNPIAPTNFSLDPENGFYTSIEDDWTVAKVKGEPNKKFGALTLDNVRVAKGDFVNIIQHPAGRFKEIGLYHNIVTSCNDRVVQYLTDTEPGSSGSPVFNSRWQVVALHHSGGMFRESGTDIKLMRNEGIHIQKIINALDQNNIIKKK